MIGGIKRFIKKNLVNESHPLLWSLWFAIRERKTFAQIDRHMRMSYAEIEAEIGRQYESMFGRKLNWDNPQTYNEKIHVSKVYMPTPLKTRLADKYLVREWIREKIGEEYLIPLLGVYDSFDEIDFDALPDKFVIKCNHDCGSVTLVNDKSKLNMKLLKRKYDFYMRRNFGWQNCETQYLDIKPKIIIEQYMGDAINDYKFTCFNETPYYCWIDIGRFGEHKRNMYNMNWELQSFNKGNTISNTNYECQPPEQFKDMKRIVEILCKGFEQVRVDLYFVEGHVYFGEMTFTGANGFSPFKPDEWDYKLGELWPFDNTVRRKILAKSSRP